MIGSTSERNATREETIAILVSADEAATISRWLRIRQWADRRFYALATLPALLVVTGVVAVPLVLGIYLSFTNYSPISPSYAWAGLVNYDAIVNNSQIHTVIRNTVVFAGAGIVIQLILGLATALLLARPIRRMAIFRVIYLLPLMVPGVAVRGHLGGPIQHQPGLGELFLHLVRLPQLNWAANPHTAMPAVLIASSWTGIPLIAIILLAGLLSFRKNPQKQLGSMVPQAPNPLARYATWATSCNCLRSAFPDCQPVPRVCPVRHHHRWRPGLGHKRTQLLRLPDDIRVRGTRLGRCYGSRARRRDGGPTAIIAIQTGSVQRELEIRRDQMAVEVAQRQCRGSSAAVGSALVLPANFLEAPNDERIS